MAKIAILVPRQSVLEQVLRILDEDPKLKEDIIEVKVIRTEDAVTIVPRGIAFIMRVDGFDALFFGHEITCLRNE